jgi:hypothetical protein
MNEMRRQGAEFRHKAAEGTFLKIDSSRCGERRRRFALRQNASPERREDLKGLSRRAQQSIRRVQKIGVESLDFDA